MSRPTAETINAPNFLKSYGTYQHPKSVQGLINDVLGLTEPKELVPTIGTHLKKEGMSASDKLWSLSPRGPIDGFSLQSRVIKPELAQKGKPFTIKQLSVFQTIGGAASIKYLYQCPERSPAIEQVEVFQPTKPGPNVNDAEDDLTFSYYRANREYDLAKKWGPVRALTIPTMSPEQTLSTIQNLFVRYCDIISLD